MSNYFGDQKGLYISSLFAVLLLIMRRQTTSIAIIITPTGAFDHCWIYTEQRFMS